MANSPSVLTAEDLNPVMVQAPPTLRDYAVVTSGLCAFGIALYGLVTRFSGTDAQARAVLAPLLAQASIVLPVWITMLVTRNYAILSRLISGTYYVSFKDDPPPDWVERPARVFNNLMELPTLFYLVGVLMLISGRVDAAQVVLAWCFVGLRALHALIYLVWNHLPSRFGSYVAGFVTLTVIWWRFASQAWDLIARG